MKYYIPHRILIINECIIQSKDDENFMNVMKLAFDWSNKMGIQGKKVFGMYLELPNINNFNPLIQHYTLWCKIECNEEQRKIWEENQEIKLKNYFFNLLNEKD